MRLPLTSPVESRDGTSNKDERLTNVLSEDDEGAKLACVRPGLRLLDIEVGNGKGLVTFNDTLISVYGSNIGGVIPGTLQWELMEIGYNDPLTYPYLQDVAGDTSLYVGVGFTSPGGVQFSVISADFLSWTVYAVTGLPIGNLYSIAHLDGAFYVAMHDNVSHMTCYRSTDGITWASVGQIKSGYIAPGWDRITENNGNLYMNGAATYYKSSNDGATWTDTLIPSGSSSIKGGADILCYLYDGESVRVSTDDGTIWDSITLPDIGEDFDFIAYGNGVFYVCSSDTARIYQSLDGVIWESLFKQSDVTAFGSMSSYGGFSANDYELVMLVLTASGIYTLCSYNFAFKKWSYVYDLSQYTVDTRVFSLDKGHMTPHNLVVNGGVDADNRFLLSLSDPLMEISAITGDFFDFAQSTL